MKNHFKIITIVLLFVTSALFADEKETNLGTIQGIVMNHETKEPVSFATIALIDPQSESIVGGVITDVDGSFALSDVPYGKYTLKVSFVGYESIEIENVEVSRKSRKINLEKLLLKQDTEALKEITVVEERLKGEEKIDRTTFTVNDDIRKTSTNGLDLLKHIPSVTVDFQENVTIEGQSDIQFYVNGVLRNKEFVAQIDPKMIDKVELITNPGVKYDADISAIVNIVLKKGQRMGVNGMVKVPLVHPTKILANPAASIDYGLDNLRFYAGDRMHAEKFNNTERLFTEIDQSLGEPFTNEKISDGKLGWYYNYLNYGVDWFVDDKNSLNFLGEWRSSHSSLKEQNSVNSMYSGNSLVNYYETLKKGSGANDNYFYSVFYKHQFDEKGNELTAELYYNKQSGGSRNEFTDTYYDVSDLSQITSAVDRNDRTVNARRTAEAKVDYTLSLEKVKQEMGASAFRGWTNNDFFVNYSIENQTGKQMENFTYDENRYAAYYNAMGKAKAWSWQAGLRAEYSDIKINQSSNTDYAVLLPQFNINRKMQNNQSVKLSYRKKIYRPSVQNLNPFETWSDSLHVFVGNPELKPALENRVELVYSKNINTSYISPKLYLRYTQNAIQDYSIIENGITRIQQDNIGQNLEYGLGLNSSVQILKRWRLNGNVAVFDRRVSTSQTIDNDLQKKWSYRFNLTNIVTLPKDFVFYAVAMYNSPNINYQREYYRDLLYLFGFEKRINEKLNVNVMYNPFVKDFTYSKVITQSPGYYEEWEGNVDVHHLFAIEFTYRFNYGKKVRKIDREVEYEKGQEGGAL